MRCNDAGDLRLGIQTKKCKSVCFPFSESHKHYFEHGKILKDAFKPIYYWARGIRYPRRTPDFFVLGATRSGTTYLHKLLDTSTDIFMSKKKELSYFNNDKKYRRDLRNYYPLFRGYNDEKMMGEATPLYLECNTIFDKKGYVNFKAEDSAIQRISKHAPNAKLIISLRDPISRIRSIYKKNYAQGKTSESLEQEILNEINGKASLNLISRNRYDAHVGSVLDFFPRNNVNIIIFEEWVSNFCVLQDNICDFLNIDPWIVNLSEIGHYSKNTSSDYILKKKRHPKSLIVSSEINDIIIDVLRPSKEFLEKTMGRKIELWKL